MKELDNLLSNQKKYFSNQLIHLSVQDRIAKIKKIRTWICSNKV